METIPLLSGWKDGAQALWCKHCEETWLVPVNDPDPKAEAAVAVLNKGLDHLESAHGWSAPE